MSVNENKKWYETHAPVAVIGEVSPTNSTGESETSTISVTSNPSKVSEKVFEGDIDSILTLDKSETFTVAEQQAMRKAVTFIAQGTKNEIRFNRAFYYIAHEMSMKVKEENKRLIPQLINAVSAEMGESLEFTQLMFINWMCFEKHTVPFERFPKMSLSINLMLDGIESRQNLKEFKTDVAHHVFEIAKISKLYFTINK